MKAGMENRLGMGAETGEELWRGKIMGIGRGR